MHAGTWFSMKQTHVEKVICVIFVEIVKNRKRVFGFIFGIVRARTEAVGCLYGELLQRQFSSESFVRYAGRNLAVLCRRHRRFFYGIFCFVRFK